MSDKSPLKRLADFEWASATQYITYVSSVAKLSEINSSHVISLPLARMEPTKLLKQKRHVLSLLERNRENLERFVRERKSQLDDHEKAVLRSLYVQYNGNIETVEAHVVFILDRMEEVELFLSEGAGEIDYDYPF